MLSYAYHIEWWRISDISDMPGLTTIYALGATTPPNTTQDQVRLMLQNLLIERLQLKIHRATRDISEGYSLTAAKNGLKLREIKPLPDSESGDFDDGYIAGTLPDADTSLVKGHSASMLQLAEFRQRDLGINPGYGVGGEDAEFTSRRRKRATFLPTLEKERHRNWVRSGKTCRLIIWCRRTQNNP